MLIMVKFFKIVKKCFKKVKNRRKKKICKMGGSITPDSKDFVKQTFFIKFTR